MNYLLIITYIVIFLISKFAFKHKYGYQWNSTFITTAIWCVFASIAVINPLGLRQPSVFIHLYSILFLISFNISSYLIHFRSITHGKLEDDGLNLRSTNIRILIVEAVCIVLVAPLLVKGFYAILSGNAGEYRIMEYYGSNRSFFTQTIPEIVLNGLMILSLYLYFYSKSKLQLINSIFIVLIISIMSSGRGTIFCFTILYIFLSIYYQSRNIKRTKLPLYIGIIGLFYVTLVVRGGDLVNSLIAYFSGSFSFLDYILTNPDDYGLDTRHYGFITLSPITEPLMYVLKVLGLTSEKIPSYYLNYYVQEFVDIGGASISSMYNNNTTALLPFILDAGWVGIIFGGWFLAFISNKCYSYFVHNKIVGAVLYLYIVNGLFMTTISYQSFMSISPIIVILVIYFCVSHNEKKDNVSSTNCRTIKL